MANRPSPAVIRPFQLGLRCYLRKCRNVENRWIAHCIDLDLWASASSPKEARKSMEAAILSYVETVLDTDESASIPELLQRRASLRYILFWHYLRLVSKLPHNGGTPPLDSEPFQQAVPFQLAHV